METKNPDPFVLSKTDQLGFEHHLLVPPTGHGAGGLALLWKQEIKLHVLSSNAHFIDTCIEYEGNTFFVAFIHGDTDYLNRRVFWNQLVSLMNARDAPWFITGDFNDILNNEEKEGGPARPEGTFSDLRSFYSEGDLYDLPHSGDLLSWRGKRNDYLVRCRLDRAAANSTWAELYPAARSHYLEFEGSDHRPLISVLDPGVKKRRGMFRYDRRLKDNVEVKALVKTVWDQSANKPIQTRISHIRSAIVEWSKKQARNSRLVIEKKKSELETALVDPQNDVELIQTITTDLEAAYKAEEEYWRQRSRLLWLRLGDRNTGYFHAVAKKRKRANSLTVIEDSNGNMFYKEDDITKVIVQYYEDLFTSLDGERAETVTHALEKRVSDEDNERLICLPSATEIRDAAFSIHADKAPGPDGFSASFYHSNWDTIGPDIVTEVQGFFASGTLPPRINETNVRLIPKIKTPQAVADYRPIALCNVYYKIISKILTKRMQPLLSSIISENQSAFVPGRAISDNVLITHEVLHYLKTSDAEKRCYMAVKTDMSKAYDRLEWEFIELVLKRLGFHDIWTSWILECVSTVTYSFLINGSPRGRVQPSRGIRQGDPLSPYIFILCGEVLSGLCNKASEEGSLQGISVARACPRVNHLLFADDTMFFTRANKKSSRCLSTILQRYKGASGQTINTAKSSIVFSRKTPATLRTLVKEELDIQKEGGVGKYLGLPEQFGRKKRDLFTSIIDKIKQKASSWTNRFLSKAGKLTMVKSVLSPIPSHSMTCFKLPVSLCKRIQSTITRFWWDDVEGQNKMAWTSWAKMTKPKALGGLGFRDFLAWNDAFLGKLSWRLHNNPDLLISRILFGKYCNSETFMEVTEKSTISHGWRGVLLGRDLLKESLGWAVGNGTSIRIWDDTWLNPSSNLRPTGPATEASANLTVADLFLPSTREWDVEKIRLILPQWELMIRSIKPSLSGAPDKQIWLNTPTGEYTTKSGYHSAIIRRNETRDEEAEEPNLQWFKGVWNLNISPKIKMFLWKVFQRAIPVGETLMARRIIDDGNCKRCGTLESIDHLFLQCPFAENVWSLAPFAETFESRRSIDLQSIWLLLCEKTCAPPTGLTAGPLAPWILWQIWCARNQLIFEGKAQTAEETLTKAIVAAKEWTNSQETKQPAPHKAPPRSLPPTNGIVLNTDAAWNLQNHRAGLGWTVKAPGNSLEFARPARFVGSALIAEGLALREGITKCRDLGIRKLRCESDSAQLIQMVNSRSFHPEIYGIVSDISSLSCCFEELSFSWIPRAKNRAADILAKQCLVGEEAFMAVT